MASCTHRDGPALVPALHALRMLGVLDRLRVYGHILDARPGDQRTQTADELAALDILARLSPKLQLSALELFVHSQRQSACLQCPECLRSLPTTTTIAGTSHGPLVAVLEHVLDHMTGKANILEVAKKGRPFAVSASMLGHYFDLHSCDRWLFRSARRIEAGREEDLESMFDAFRHANRTRGNDFEDWLCERLGRPGLPVAWSARVTDATAPEGAIWTTSSGSGAAASSSGGGVGGGSGGLDIAADPAHIRFLTEEEWAREAAEPEGLHQYLTGVAGQLTT